MADPDPRPPLYGLDIETDTTVDGLDPAVGRVLAVAVATADGVTVFDDADEAQLLGRLDRHLAGLAPGVIVTWNGARFDLPYLSTRAGAAGVGLGLALVADPSRARPPRSGDRPPAGPGRRLPRLVGPPPPPGRLPLLPGRRGPGAGHACSLKAVAALAGLAPVEVDAARVHVLDRATLARLCGQRRGLHPRAGRPAVGQRRPAVGSTGSLETLR